MAHVPNRQTPPLVARTDIRGSLRLDVQSVDSHWNMEAVPGVMSVFSLSTHSTLPGGGLPSPPAPLLVVQPEVQRRQIHLTSLAALSEDLETVTAGAHQLEIKT